MRSGFVFWGLALLTGGALALAEQLGYVNSDGLAELWRFWPLILVAIGLSIVLAHTRFALVGTSVAALLIGAAGGMLIAVGPPSVGCAGDEPVNLTTVEGDFGGTAEVALDFDCGTLEVAIGTDPGWSVASGRHQGPPASVEATDNRLEVRSGGPGSWWESGRQRWVIGLPRETTYERLSVEANAASSTLDLREGRIELLDLEVNAGALRVDLIGASVRDVALTLNAGSATFVIGPGTAMIGVMEVNAGSISVCAAADQLLAIRLGATNAFGHNLEESGLVLVGDMWSNWQGPLTGPSVEITINGNAGSFTLNPEDGCE